MGAVIRGHLEFFVQVQISDAGIIREPDMKAHELMVKDTLEHRLRYLIRQAVENDLDWEQARKKIRWHTLDLTGMAWTPGLDDDDIRESSGASDIQEDREGEQ